MFHKKFTTELFYKPKDFGYDKKIVNSYVCSTVLMFNELHKYKSEKTKQNYKTFMASKLPICTKPAQISDSVS